MRCYGISLERVEKNNLRGGRRCVRRVVPCEDTINYIGYMDYTIFSDSYKNEILGEFLWKILNHL